MTVHVEQMNTDIETISAPPPASTAATGARDDTPAARERARRSAERAARIVRRTHAEGYDD
jgi:hypothetical protein